MTKQEWKRIWSMYRGNGCHTKRWVSEDAWEILMRVKLAEVDWLAFRAKWMATRNEFETPKAVLQLTTRLV